MKLTEKFMFRLVNKALESYNITMEELWKNSGLVGEGKKAKYWWETGLDFKTEESYESHKKWCLEQIRLTYHIDGEELLAAYNEFDCCLNLSEPFRFVNKREPEIKKGTIQGELF